MDSAGRTPIAKPVEPPNSLDGGVAHPEMFGQLPGRPLAPSREARLEGCFDYSANEVRRKLNPRPCPRSVVSDPIEARPGVPAAPKPHGDKARPELLRDLPVLAPLRRSQHDSDSRRDSGWDGSASRRTDEAKSLFPRQPYGRGNGHDSGTHPRPSPGMITLPSTWIDTNDEPELGGPRRSSRRFGPLRTGRMDVAPRRSYTRPRRSDARLRDEPRDPPTSHPRPEGMA